MACSELTPFPVGTTSRAALSRRAASRGKLRRGSWYGLGIASLAVAAVSAPSPAAAQTPTNTAPTAAAPAPAAPAAASPGAPSPAAAAPAVAPPRDPATVARADAAFEEGRELFDQGRFKEACEKFELSMKFDPSPGTLLNLGNCYEPQGDLVRALSTFEQAFADAQRSNDQRRKELWTDASRERIGNLSRRVPQLSVRSVPPDGQVAIDGKALARPSGAIRINPGRHRIDVSAPGKQTYSHEFEITSGQRLALNVPPLEADTSPSAPPPALVPIEPVPQQDTRTDTYGPWPYVLGGTGAVLLGTSLITGLMANSKASKLDRECDSAGNCAPPLEGTRDSAQSLALATDVLWISGVIVAGVGVTLFVLDASDDESSTTVQAGCFSTGCGMLASGHF